MSSRLKERGGAGAKIMASNPHKVLTDGTPTEKVATRRTPIAAAGKENPRSISSGRASVACSNLVIKKAEKRMVPAVGGVRWSTSSMPRGKPLNPSDFSRILPDPRGDRFLRVSGTDRTGRRDSEAEVGQKKSLAGFRGLERCNKGTERLDPNSKAKNVKPMNGVRGLENCKPVKNGSRVLGVIPGRNGDKAVNVDVTHVGLENRGRKDDLDSSLTSLSVKGSNMTIVSKESNSISVSKDGTNAINEAYLEVPNLGNKDVNDAILFSSSTSSNGNSLDGDIIFDAGKERNCSGSNPNALPEVTRHDADVLMNYKEKDCLVSQSEGCGPLHVGLDHKGELREKSEDMIRVFENMSERRSDGGVKSVHVINRYPSKLHEKLALLEGKVQKIASEIKRTKEMLDLNNPDESKLILSDIQNKISGIEKAVGHVVSGSAETSKADDLHCNIATEISQPEELVDSKASVKGLNHEELEARFFPHHRLLRNRTSLSSSGGQDRACGSNLLKHDVDPEVKDVSLSSIDENPIALEFLASLCSEQLPNILKHDAVLLSESAALRERGMDNISSHHNVTNKAIGGQWKDEIALLADEKLEEFDDQENKPAMVVDELSDDSCADQLREIGQKSSTGGWFVSEGEAVLLAHNDGSCSYYDITNLEVKAEYKPPSGISDNLWGDCWLIRAPGADGSSGRYVVAASAGNSLDSGFCSWDFYTRDITAFRVEGQTPNSFSASSSSSSSRTVLAPLPNSGLYGRSTACSIPAVENPQWWYRPCGPLLISTACKQKIVSAYDIRDGDVVMKWEVSSPVTGMEFSSPLQWRSRGKVIVAETEAITLWDVNSLTPQPLLSVPSAGKKVYSLHVNNTDAELGGGVRQRVSSSEVEGNDGVFCTQDSVSVFDFRLPTGVGLKISRHGGNGHSIYSRGDSIFIGCTDGRSATRGSLRSRVQHFSLRKGKLAATYAMPDFNSHIHHSLITQVWGNSNLVMGICGMGLFVFDALMDDFSGIDRGSTIQSKEAIGSDDLYCPTFDYLGSRVLVISRDRPALWRYLT